MRLKQWQLSLETYLLQTDGEPPAALLASLQGSANLDVQTGLAIYHNAYRARLQETLRGDFPVLLAWLGEDAFAQLAGEYLHAHPSTHFSLRWLGARFASFIEQVAGLDQRAALAELATLEWAFTLAFDAPAGEPLTMDAMLTMPPEQWPALQVTGVPALQWLACRFNTLALWRAHQDDAPLPVSSELVETSQCLVWRNGLQGQFRSLSPGEGEALRGMTQQAWTFAELCASLAHLHDGAAVQAAGWLKLWISEGLLQRR